MMTSLLGTAVDHQPLPGGLLDYPLHHYPLSLVTVFYILYLNRSKTQIEIIRTKNEIRKINETCLKTHEQI